MMASGTLDDQYLEWLYKSIGVIRNTNPSRSYWELAKQLYSTPFIWSVPNDDNRAEDGKCLREEFMLEEDLDILESDPWMELDCSVLEMLIALSRRASFQNDEHPGDWFWCMIDHLAIRYPDQVYSNLVRMEVAHNVDIFLNRDYQRNGDGGLFPLRHAKRDQRTVEISYQLSAYLLEGRSASGP